MCSTCVRLLGVSRCPPARAVRDVDFERDLVRERDAQDSLSPWIDEAADVDAVTGLVLRARFDRHRGTG